MRLIDADALMESIRKALGIKSMTKSLLLPAERTIIDQIDSAPTVGGWISVKDRLPGEWITVLTFQPTLSDGEGLIRTAVYIGTGKWREAERHELMELPVTHWMPLPEPPKEEQDG